MPTASEIIAYRLTVCQRNHFKKYSHITGPCQLNQDPEKGLKWSWAHVHVSLADSKSIGNDLGCSRMLVIEL